LSLGASIRWIVVLLFEAGDHHRLRYCQTADVGAGAALHDLAQDEERPQVGKLDAEPRVPENAPAAVLVGQQAA
jgi:hypothetical protein